MKGMPIRTLVTKTRQVDPRHLGRESFVYVDISAIDRETKRISTPQELSVLEAPSRARKQIKVNDVLVSTVRPNLNAIALVPPELDGEIASTGFCVLRPVQSKLDSGYLHYFCQHKSFVDRLTRLSIGAGYPAVSDNDIFDADIPLPPLPEQQRIAGILSRADRLRRLRRYALDVSDGYLQSVFLEMFGDLLQDEQEWPLGKLGDIADVVSGVTKGQRFGQRATVMVPYLRVANVQDGYLDLGEVKLIKALTTDVEKLRLQVGDIVMTEGGDYDKLGRGAIWEGQISECIHQNHIFRVRLDPAIVRPVFFASLLLTPYTKSYFLRASKQTTNLATINMTQLKAFPVPIPSPELQKRFVSIAKDFSNLRDQQREALRQAEHLFQTLLHGAFYGERE